MKHCWKEYFLLLRYQRLLKCPILRNVRDKHANISWSSKVITYLAYFVMYFFTCFSAASWIYSEADINTQSHIYVFVMINSSHLPQAPHMNVEEFSADLKNSPHCSSSFWQQWEKYVKMFFAEKRALSRAKHWICLYWFGISHDFCYFLKCSNLFNYHNILCSRFHQLPSFRDNLFFCFS